MKALADLGALRVLRADDEDQGDDPIVHQGLCDTRLRLASPGRVLCREAVEPLCIAAQGLHDQQVVKLIILLGTVDVPDLR